MSTAPPHLPRAASALGLAAALCLAAALGFPACVPPSDTADPTAELTVDFADPAQRDLYDYQDRLQVDSLLPYLRSDDPQLRYLAARAFGSVRSPRAVDSLAATLRDPVASVRATAAYALGQQGDPRAQEPLLASFTPEVGDGGVYVAPNAAILEAIGKVGDTSMLRGLTSVNTYLPTDTLLLLGQTRGVYRMMLRGLTAPAGTSLMLGRATTAAFPPEVRLVAAHYLARADVSLAGHLPRLRDAVDAAEDPELRFALSRALGKTGGDAPAPQQSAAEAIAARFLAEADPMARVALLEAAGELPAALTRGMLLGAARDRHPLVSETAARVLRDRGVPADATDYWRLAKDSIGFAASVELYAAALRHMPTYQSEYRGYVNAEIRRRFAAAADPYERAAWLRALGAYPWNFRYLLARDTELATPVERSALAESLRAIVRREGIRRYFGGSFATVRRELAAYLREAFAGDDPGLQAAAAGILAESAWDFAAALPDLQFLADAQGRLTLPRDTETYYAIEDARAALRPGYEARREPPAYNHPIDWNLYRSLQPGLEAAIETDRGRIVIEFFEDAAPASVVNFVQSVRNGYYNDKTFHRVVPGFVTQGGGTRGDGYGTLDYSLRSETPPRYYDHGGYVGMASAGPHTEGVQFFFTHVATPHLDGRYTVIGRVTEGMDAVRRLRVGDRMRMKLQ